MLEQIKTFVAVVNQGSFTLAAETLQSSRSVISKKISALEVELGVRLINRTTRRLSLTEAGEHFFQQCNSSLNSIDEAAEQVRSLNLEPRGRLFVNLPMSFGLLQIAPLVGEFIKRYPLVKVDLNFDDRKLETIAPGFDVSIRIADLPDSSLTARKLAPCHHLVVAAPEYVEQFGLPSSPEDLVQGHVIASFSLQDSALEWEFQKPDTKTQRIALNARMIANNSLAIKELVLSGIAMARMPSFIVGPDVAAGKLIKLLPEYQCMTKSIYAVFPKREFLPAKTRAFIDFLAEKFRGTPLWDRDISI